MWPILSDLDFQLEQSENENPALLSCMVLFRMLLQTYGLESALDEFDYHRLRHRVVKLSSAPQHYVAALFIISAFPPLISLMAMHYV